jgi:hypothetical protein
VDERKGVGEAGAPGRAALRLCTLGAQSPLNAEGSVPAGGGEGTDGKEEEPSELIYFKVYKSQIPVIEQAIETAARMLGTDKSRGYCLEMICADFLAGAHLDNGNPEILLHSISRYYRFLPGDQQQAFLENLCEKAS